MDEQIVDWKVSDDKVYVLTNKDNFYVYNKHFQNGNWFFRWDQMKRLPFMEDEK